MSSRSVFFLVLFSLVLIFGTQIYLVTDYYYTTRAGWIKESNVVVDEAFKADLKLRNEKYKGMLNESILVLAPPDPSLQNTTFVDVSESENLNKNVANLIDMAIHKLISTVVPLNLNQLDSITSRILLARDIHSKFTINLVNNATGEIIESSRNNWRSSLFLISSEPMLIDSGNQLALQLHLINPFQIIIKRMGLMLSSSLVLSLICILAFIYLQKVLARQKKLVAFKNEFLGTIAHELKRPVSSLTFNLDCLSMSSANLDTPQNSLLLNNSIRATEELNDAINMIVTLSKHEEGMLILNCAPMDTLALLDELKDKFSEPRFKNKQVTIALLPEGNLPDVSADRLLMIQCFSNLLDNAIKYSGEIVNITIRIERKGHWLSVAIQDNGFGIPEDKLELVFDKYSRVHLGKTQIKGFGIGLNYVKTIIEKHGGEVNVKSEPGVGSEFTVLLPVS